jgi:5S rRNA maturation endonuclease (ribonuclease M5)
MIYPETQSWSCHDCKHGGSVIDWLMMEKNISAADAMRMLGGGSNGSAEIVATYDYSDETGKLLFQTVRYHPKNFAQRQPDGEGGWIWNLKGVQRVLYRLGELRSALNRGLPAILVEGEKDVDALARLGLPMAVTCNPLGAGKWREEYSEILRGAIVYVIADKDDPGREHAQQVATPLHGKGKRVAVLELPDRNGHKVKDASDWLAAGGSGGELAELLEAAPEWTPQTKKVELAAVLDSICEFLRRHIVFASMSQSIIIALWVAHTWILDAFDCTPYLHVSSPEKSSGKTKLLDRLELIAAKVWRAISPSRSAQEDRDRSTDTAVG